MMSYLDTSKRHALSGTFFIQIDFDVDTIKGLLEASFE